MNEGSAFKNVLSARQSKRRPGPAFAQVAAQTLRREHREQVPASVSWTKTFTDPRLCAAIVDRLTFGGNIIETGSDSYRLAHTKARQQTTAGS